MRSELGPLEGLGYDIQQDAARLDGLHGRRGMALELGAISREQLDHVARAIAICGRGGKLREWLQLLQILRMELVS